MPSLTTQMTVGQIVAQRPALSRVFENLGIDYCCGGKKTLAAAAAEQGLDAQTVVRTLEAAQTVASNHSSTRDPAGMTLSELADHIEQTHHAYLRRDLPRLEQMIRKVAQVHGPNNPKLDTLLRVFLALQDEMAQHMMKEEQILFPIVRTMERSHEPQQFHCGSVANPIRVMEQEHDGAGAALARMNELTDGYVPPADACNTYRAMLDGLRELEQDMHQHVHKENNILFPRAIELESRLGVGSHA